MNKSGITTILKLVSRVAIFSFLSQSVFAGPVFTQNMRGLVPQEASQNSVVDAGYFVQDTREKAYGGPIFSAVQKLIVDGGWCSAVLISPDFALTAAHCIAANPQSLAFDDGSGNWTNVAIDKSWKSTNYANDWTDSVNNINFYHEDFGFVHLAGPIPAWATTLSVALPNEIEVGMPAMSIGYPDYTYHAEARIKDDHCTVRKLLGEEILTDCAMSAGNSGGPLMVKTISGEWKIAGLCSTEWVDANRKMSMGLPYSDVVANRYTNISYYAARVAKTIFGFNGEKIASLESNNGYDEQCLISLSYAILDSVNNEAYTDCLQVKTAEAVGCYSAAFANLSSISDTNLDRLNICSTSQAVHVVTKLFAAGFTTISDQSILDAVSVKTSAQEECMSKLIDHSAASGNSNISDADFDGCL